MEIEIKRIITNEYQNGNFNIVDLNHLEDFLIKKSADKDYGESVVKYFFGFELYKFDGGFAQFHKDDVESWKTKTKWFVSNAHFDWNQFINLNAEQIINIIKQEFTKSIGRIENMKRKPKDFDFKLFQKDFEEAMSEYKNVG